MANIQPPFSKRWPTDNKLSVIAVFYFSVLICSRYVIVNVEFYNLYNYSRLTYVFAQRSSYTKPNLKRVREDLVAVLKAQNDFFNDVKKNFIQVLSTSLLFYLHFLL